MACSATLTTGNSLVSPISKPSQTLNLPSSFFGHQKSLQFRSPRSFSLNQYSQSRKTFVLKASSELPLVGNVAPDFEAEAFFDQEFINVKLSDHIGKKYVILFFYPLDFSFVCPTEITAFSDRHAEFEKMNAEVLGVVSVDSVCSHLAWIQTERKSGGLGDLKYPLISDVTKSISKSFEVLIPDQFSHLAWIQTERKSGGLGDLKYPLISDVTKSISKLFGVLIPDQGIALRGLFIIDKEGVIQHSTVNNLATGQSVDETLRTLQALQYVQENPYEVCPGGWKPGTITPIFLPPKPPKSDTPPIFPPLKNPPSLQRPPNAEFQEKILYLDSIGIDIFSLSDHHRSIILSASLTDIKSVVDLFTSMDFNSVEFRRIVSMCPEILISNASTILPIFTFLLREARVKGSDIKHVIHRRPRLLVSSVKHRLRPTMYFLQSIGIEDVSKHTDLLSCSVEDKLLPRIEYFEKFGFPHKVAISMFRRFPPLFNYSIKKNIESKLNYFVVEMRRDLRELKEFPQYFSFSLENRIKPRHQYCVEKGVYFPLRTLLKSNGEQFRGRLELCCNSSIPLSISPLFCTKFYFDSNTE